MIVAVVFRKIKAFILILVNLLRRVLCCFRRRRRSNSDTVPLTHVISNTEGVNSDIQNWGDWENGSVNKPKTVQDHIELYRKQAQISRQGQESPDPEDLNFFEDMTPKITKQAKVLINAGQGDSARSLDRLSFVEESVNAVPSAELREWEESTGWEGEALDYESQKVLREKKRQERERRAWEQQQKRLEKMNRSLGSKLSA